MGNSGGAALPLPPEVRQKGAAGCDELARGLMLVRASAMKMARLHLALERRDRRLVLETMDDLVALDGRIRDLVDEIPTSDSAIGILQNELEEQRIALAREKLILAAGISRKEKTLTPPGLAAEEGPPAEILEAAPVEAAQAKPEAVPELADAPLDDADVRLAALERHGPRDGTAFGFGLASLVIVAVAIGLAAIALGTSAGQGLIDRILTVASA